MQRSSAPPRSAQRRRHGAALLVLACGILLACHADLESRMREIRALQDGGHFAESIEPLRAVLDEAPQLREASYRLGLALAQTGEPIRAAWPLQQAIDDPDYVVSAGLLLATLYLQTQNFDESVRAADRVLEADPDHVDALRVRSNAQVAARRLSDALADAERLLSLAPDDYHAQALVASTLADLGRLEEAGAAHERLKVLGAASEDPVLRQRSCIAPAIFAADHLHDTELARRRFEACIEGTPSDPFVLETLSRFHDAASEPERATALIAAAAAAAPDNLPLQLLHARRLFASGDADAALDLLARTARHVDSASAWSALASAYRAADRHEDALRAVEKAIERSTAVDPLLRFTQADVLIDLGELDRARAIAAVLDHDTYAHLIRGRLLLISGDPEAALAEFEQGIRAWPNNPGARFLAGLAARDLGDYERALTELREAVRAGRGETDAALELARIHFERGEYEQAIAFANTHLTHPEKRQQPGAWVVATRALVAQGKHERALRTIEALAQQGFALEATRERARLERGRGQPAQAVAQIEASALDPLDPAHFELLGQLVEARTEQGRIDEALASAEAALARRPDSGPLQQIHAVALLRAGRASEAEAAFQRAIELDGSQALSLSGLATLRHAAGDLAAAIDFFDRADALDPGDGSHAYASAQLLLQQGNLAEAERRLRAVVERNPGHVGAANDLAWLLAEQRRDLDLALELVEAARRRSDAPEILDTAGWVRLRRGEFGPALRAFEQAVAERPDSASTRYRHALALEGAGQPERAQAALEAALALGSFPEAEKARAALTRLRARPASP